MTAVERSAPIRNFELRQGDERTLSLPVTYDLTLEVPISPAAAIEWWMCEGALPDPATLRVRRVRGEGLELVNESGVWVVKVRLDEGDTVALPPGDYYHEARVADPSGDARTLVVGIIKLRPSVIAPGLASGAPLPPPYASNAVLRAEAAAELAEGWANHEPGEDVPDAPEGSRSARHWASVSQDGAEAVTIKAAEVDAAALTASQAAQAAGAAAATVIDTVPVQGIYPNEEVGRLAVEEGRLFAAVSPASDGYIDLWRKDSPGASTLMKSYPTLSQFIAVLAQAQSARAAAEGAKLQAETIAQAAGAAIYMNTAAGLAATPNGSPFLVPGDNRLIIFLNNNGVAEQVTTLGGLVNIPFGDSVLTTSGGSFQHTTVSDTDVPIFVQRRARAGFANVTVGSTLGKWALAGYVNGGFRFGLRFLVAVKQIVGNVVRAVLKINVTDAEGNDWPAVVLTPDGFLGVGADGVENTTANTPIHTTGQITGRILSGISWRNFTEAPDGVLGPITGSHVTLNIPGGATINSMITNLPNLPHVYMRNLNSSPVTLVHSTSGLMLKGDENKVLPLRGRLILVRVINNIWMEF
jgi:hypothetical protein